MEEDVFKKITDQEHAAILKTLKKDWPKHFILHNYMSFTDVFKKYKHLISQAVYCSGSFDNGVYLIKTTFFINPDKLTVYFVYTLSNDMFSLSKALKSTSRIAWQRKAYIFEITMNRFTPAVCQVFVDNGLKAAVQHYCLLWLPPDIEVNVCDIPHDVYLDSLNERHSLEIAKNWPGFPGHETFLAYQIIINGGFGIFRKSDRKLLSYALNFHSGGVYMLYTDSQFRRKGYGEIIIRHMVRNIRLQRRVPFCTVFSDNVASQELVRKIGFTDYDKCNSIFPLHLLDSST